MKVYAAILVIEYEDEKHRYKDYYGTYPTYKLAEIAAKIALYAAIHSRDNRYDRNVLMGIEVIEQDI